MKSNKQYILALDQGTTSSRSIIYDQEFNTLASSQKEFKQIFSQPGWVEHDAEEIWETQLFTIKEVLRKASLKAENIHCIGVTNQRETTVVWDKITGKPICNAIVWQCRRSAEIINSLKDNGYAQKITDKTGLIPDAYFSAGKLTWLFKNNKIVAEKAKKKELCFGTIDSWLIYKLTDGKFHVTDYSNASRTMLFNIHTKEWDSELLELFEIPRHILPKVIPSSGQLAETAKNIFGANIPISGIAGDQQAALYGQNCFKKGDLKVTYGTGCFLLMNTGKTIPKSKNGLLATIAWHKDGQTIYALEGSVFVGGSVVQWLRDQLGIIKNASETEELAFSVKDNGGVYFVPAFTGLGAPYWDSHAKGCIVGLTRGSGKGHIVRASLESIAFQCQELITAMEKDSSMKIHILKADGGAAKNAFLMQFQANILNCSITVPEHIESTALGAAKLAWDGISSFTENSENSNKKMAYKIYKPNFTEKNRKSYLKLWQNAIKSSKIY